MQNEKKRCTCNCKRSKCHTGMNFHQSETNGWRLVIHIGMACLPIFFTYHKTQKHKLLKRFCGRTACVQKKDRLPTAPTVKNPRLARGVMKASARMVTRNFTLAAVTQVQNPSWKRKYGSVSRKEMTDCFSCAMPAFTASTTHCGTVPSRTTVIVALPVTLVRCASPTAPSIRNTNTTIFNF